MPTNGPICEECDEEMHRFSNGEISGWSCDLCGWSDDDPSDVEHKAIPNDNAPELKPCPFCGGIAIMHVPVDSYAPPYLYYVLCGSSDCTVDPRTDSYETRSEAAEAWNTRPPASLPGERKKELVEVLERTVFHFESYIRHVDEDGNTGYAYIEEANRAVRDARAALQSCEANDE